MLGYEQELFCGERLDAKIKARREGIPGVIGSLGSHELVSTDFDKKCAELIESFRIVVPDLNVGGIAVHRSGDTRVDKDGLRVRDEDAAGIQTGTYYTFSIPYSGSAAVFRYNPSKVVGTSPKAQILDGELQISVTGTDLDESAIDAELQKSIQLIQMWLDQIKAEVAPFNEEVEQLVRETAESRRHKLLKDQETLLRLKYPIKVRDNAPQAYKVLLEQKRVPVSISAQNPYYELEIADYERILYVISCMATVMERCPEAFTDMHEEHIRHHFLIPLNALYEGQATGETFNLNGKTDILIRVAGKNVFIAECKFWKGEKAFVETIDQLLSYKSWRDTKTAAIIFSENDDFSKVLEQIPDAVKSHNNFVRELDQPSPTDFRYEFHHKGDTSQMLLLTVMAFNIPKKKDGSKQ